MHSTHLSYMNAALREAKKALQRDEVPVGAVIVKKGKIISRGHNQKETLQCVLEHAELIAIRSASKQLNSWRLDGCDLYVTLEPCAMCAGALQQARIRHVYYGVSDLKGGVVTLNLNIYSNKKLNHSYLLTCLEVQECGEILSSFFQKKRL